MRTILSTPLARRLQRAALVIATGVLAAGCVAFNGSTTAVQAGTGDVGTTLRYTLSVCSNGATSGGTGNSAGGSCAPTFSAIGIPSSGRMVAAILVPVGSNAPATVTATLSAPATVTRDGVSGVHSDLRAFRALSAAADFNAQTPPPAGSTWVPYITEIVAVGPGVSLSADATIDVIVPADAIGNPVATAARQVSLADGGTYGGSEPAAGETDTLTFDCYVDTNDDGTPDVAPECADAFDPAAPEAVTFRRLALTGASSATVSEAGDAATTNLTLRLDGVALASPDVTITAAITGAGLSATAPATVTTVLGANVTIPVTLTAARGAQPGNLTVTARTSGGTARVAIVPVNVLPQVVPPTILSRDDGTRPGATITARRLANGRIRLAGTATDEFRSAGLTSVKVQAIHGIGRGRCLAWTGRTLVTERCSASLGRWIALPLTLEASTTSVDWSVVTPRATAGLWLLRVRSADGDGLVSRVGTARVTVPTPRAAWRARR